MNDSCIQFAGASDAMLASCLAFAAVAARHLAECKPGTPEFSKRLEMVVYWHGEIEAIRAALSAQAA